MLEVNLEQPGRPALRAELRRDVMAGGVVSHHFAGLAPGHARVKVVAFDDAGRAFAAASQGTAVAWTHTPQTGDEPVAGAQTSDEPADDELPDDADEAPDAAEELAGPELVDEAREDPDGPSPPGATSPSPDAPKAEPDAPGNEPPAYPPGEAPSVELTFWARPNVVAECVEFLDLLYGPVDAASPRFILLPYGHLKTIDSTARGFYDVPDEEPILVLDVSGWFWPRSYPCCEPPPAYHYMRSYFRASDGTPLSTALSRLPYDDDLTPVLMLPEAP